MSKTYYVGNMPVSDELYHYGRKGMKWGKNIFDDVTNAVGNAAANTAKNVRSAVESGAKKAGAYISGEPARSNYDKQAIRTVVKQINGAPTVRARGNSDWKSKSDSAKQYRNDAQTYFNEAKQKPFYDLHGKATSNVKGIESAEKAQKYQKESDDLKRAQNQVNREFREEMREQKNAEANAKREYEKTLPGSIEKTKKNVSKAASNTAKSVSNFASQSAKSVSDWGSNQVNNGKKLFKKLFK